MVSHTTRLPIYLYLSISMSAPSAARSARWRKLHMSNAQHGAAANVTGTRRRCSRRLARRGWPLGVWCKFALASFASPAEPAPHITYMSEPAPMEPAPLSQTRSASDSHTRRRCGCPLAPARRRRRAARPLGPRPPTGPLQHLLLFAHSNLTQSSPAVRRPATCCSTARHAMTTSSASRP